MPASSEPVTLLGDVHARPAGALEVAAGRFAAAVPVTAGAGTVDAKSVLGVMGLGAMCGQQVMVSAGRPDAAEAVAALIAILGEATRVGGLPHAFVTATNRHSRVAWPRARAFGWQVLLARRRSQGDGDLVLQAETDGRAGVPDALRPPDVGFERALRHLLEALSAGSRRCRS